MCIAGSHFDHFRLGFRKDFFADNIESGLPAIFIHLPHHRHFFTRHAVFHHGFHAFFHHGVRVADDGKRNGQFLFHDFV